MGCSSRIWSFHEDHLGGGGGGGGDGLCRVPLAPLSTPLQSKDSVALNGVSPCQYLVCCVHGSSISTIFCYVASDTPLVM